MERVYVLGARRWDFDDDGGVRRQGVTIHYVAGDNAPEDGVKGEIPMRITAPAEAWHQLDGVPGWVDLDLRMRSGRDGKPQLSVVGVHAAQAKEVG